MTAMEMLVSALMKSLGYKREDLDNAIQLGKEGYAAANLRIENLERMVREIHVATVRPVAISDGTESGADSGAAI